jgi:hypothetical protein
MSDFVTDKRQITKKVLSILAPNFDDKRFMHALRYWWANKRENGGLSLTYEGKYAFEDADIEGYEVDTEGNGHIPSFVLLLDRRMQCPYYIAPHHKKQIIIYDGRIAGLIQLYETIDRYLAAISDR